MHQSRLITDHKSEDERCWQKALAQLIKVTIRKKYQGEIHCENKIIRSKFMTFFW